MEFDGLEYEDDEDQANVVLRFNTCDSSRDKIGDLECRGADLEELLKGQSVAVGIAIGAVFILCVLCVIGCVVVVRHRRGK